MHEGAVPANQENFDFGGCLDMNKEFDSADDFDKANKDLPPGFLPMTSDQNLNGSDSPDPATKLKAKLNACRLWRAAGTPKNKAFGAKFNISVQH